jgi:hypothetical protein
MDWKDIEQQITQDDQHKWDRKASGRELRIAPTGKLERLNGNGEPSLYSLSDLATSEMCQKLDIPVAYYRRLPGEMQARVANYDLERLNGSSYLLRGKGEWIRAFLSADYVPYNNAQIADAIQGLLREAPVSVKSFVLEETHMFVKVVAGDLASAGLKAGVMIGNSEVGMGSHQRSRRDAGKDFPSRPPPFHRLRVQPSDGRGHQQGF